MWLNPQKTADLVTFTEENLNENFIFCSVYCIITPMKNCLKNLSMVHNRRHNILRILDVFPNFPFTTSETKPDY